MERVRTRHGRDDDAPHPDVYLPAMAPTSTELRRFRRFLARLLRRDEADDRN